MYVICNRECDASEHAMAATLNHGRQPVVILSRTFSKCEARYSTAEKEAVAIMDAVFCTTPTTPVFCNFYISLEIRILLLQLKMSEGFA